MRINAPIAPPTTAGTGIEDLPSEVLELGWPGGPMSELLVGDGFDAMLVMTGVLEGMTVTVLEGVSVDDDGGVEGGSDEAEDDTDTDGV